MIARCVLFSQSPSFTDGLSDPAQIKQSISAMQGSSRKPLMVTPGASLIGLMVALRLAANWLWSYLTFGRGVRLITGDVAMQPERNQADRADR